MLYLKVSTAVTLKIGPFLDSTDGNTVEDGLTVSQADVRLSKNGGNIAQKNESTACTHDELGYYDCPINATDTGTLGRLQVIVHKGGALPVYHEFIVVTANVYDTLCSTDYFDVNLVADQSDASIGLSAAAVDAIFDEALSGHTTAGTLGKNIADVNQATFGKWEISGLNLTFYASDNTTILKQFTLDNATVPTKRTPT